MPISSVAGMTQHQMLKSKVPGSDVIVSNHPPPPRTATLLCCSVAECRWLGWVQYVQTQLDGGVSIPQARTKKWKNKAKKRDARKEHDKYPGVLHCGTRGPDGSVSRSVRPL